MRALKTMGTCFLVATLLLAMSWGQAAPGGPGAIPTWTPGSKEAVGTSTTLESRVWFTLPGGVLTEVYYPRLDVTDVRSLEFAVTDGKSVWVESRDLNHAIDSLDQRALLFRQASRHPRGLFTLTKTYVTDPTRDTLLIDVTFRGEPGRYRLYVLYQSALNSSGAGNSGSDEQAALTAWKGDLASALVSSVGFTQLANGFAAVNDGCTDLLLHRNLTWLNSLAENGNIVQTAQLPARAHFTLALGFGSSPALALDAARTSLRRGFAAVRADYVGGWRAYVYGLRHVNETYRKEKHLSRTTLRILQGILQTRKLGESGVDRFSEDG